MLKKEDKEMIKETLVASLPSLSLVFGVLFMSLILKLRFDIIVLMIVLLVTIVDVYKVVKGDLPPEPLRLLKNGGFTIFYLLTLTIILTYLGMYGVIGFILMVLLLSGWILFRNRKLYMGWIRHIESRFFGMTAEERKQKRRKGG